MKPSKLFAASAALFVFSTAGASTITQTVSFNRSDAGIASTLHAGGTWAFTRFDQPGSLDSATLEVLVDGALSSSEFNPLSFPLTWNASLVLETYYFVGDVNANYLSPIVQALAASTTTVLVPLQTASLSGTASTSTTKTFTSPGDLSMFLGPGPVIVLTSANMQNPSGFAHSSLSADTTITLTYNYRVPETGTTLGLLACGVLAAVALRRRLHTV